MNIFYRLPLYLQLVAGTLALATSATAGPDSLSLYFASGKTRLTAVHQQTLDSLLYAEIDARQPLQIWATADEPGTIPQNKSIAQARAEAVKQYLLESGMQPARIVSCKGRGNPEKLGDKPEQRRAVLIFDTSSAAVMPPPPPAVTASIFANPKKLKAQDVVTLNNLLFHPSTASFMLASMPVLEELYQVLESNPALKIRIEGHSCCGGGDYMDRPNASWGKEVSERRAAAVYQYLVDRGIGKERLSFVGRGFSTPKFFPETTEAKQALNRRVEVVITGVK